MKVCHISTVHSAFDDRIFFKECISLSKNGFEVCFLVKHKLTETKENISIIPLPIYSGRFSRFFKGTFSAFNRALKIKAKLYHFHDPELMFLGVLLRLSGKKVIYDVHEDLPKQVLYKEWIKSEIIRLLLSKLINISEQFCSYFFNATVSATDDIANKFKHKKYNIVVKNYPILDFIKVSGNLNINKHKFTFIYAGGLTKVRGIKEIIQAMELINHEAELWLLGEFDSDDYKKECELLDGWKKVSYFGFVKLNVVFEYINKADAGLALLYPIKNYLTSLPVKAFEYMALAKPMIVSDFPFWKKIFKDSSLFCNPYSPKDIAEQMQFLIINKEIAIEIGKKGQSRVFEEYSWSNEEKKLLNLYNSLLNEN